MELKPKNPDGHAGICFFLGRGGGEGVEGGDHALDNDCFPVALPSAIENGLLQTKLSYGGYEHWNDLAAKKAKKTDKSNPQGGRYSTENERRSY